jgi:hypothetical protein
MANLNEGAVHFDGPAAPLPATTIATLPVGSFLENIAVRKNGDLLVTSMSDKELYQLSPPSPQDPSTWTAEVTGIVEYQNNPDTFYVSVWEAINQGNWAVRKISLRTSHADPAIEHFADIPGAIW